MKTPRSPFPVAVLVLALLFAGCSDDDGPSSRETALLETARGLADTFIEEEPATSVPWSWGEGVLMIGMLELARTTGDPVYEDYAIDWLRFHQSTGYVIFWSDSIPPATVASLLIGRRGLTEFQPILDDVDRYLFDLAPRTSDGGIAHLGFLPVFFKQQLWVDSLFMFGQYLIQTHDRTGDPRYLDEILDQYAIFADRMQHPTLDLFTHSWNDPNHSTNPPLDEEIFWNRGNSWVLVSGVDLMALLAPEDPRRAAVGSIVGRHFPAILGAEDPSGLYWTVLNRPGEGYLETAGSALLGYGMARGYEEGILGAEAADAALRTMNGLLTRLRVEDGHTILSGTSVGTNPGRMLYYATVPTRDNVSYGVGGTLLLASRLVELERAGRIDLDSLTGFPETAP